MSDSFGPLQPRSSQFINGKTVRIFGPMQSMSVREAAKLIRSYGGVILSSLEGTEKIPADWIIIGESQQVYAEASSAAVPEWLTDQLREDIECGLTHLATETQLLQRLFPCDDQSKDLTSLYTPAMLAELLNVTVSDVRRWYQRGLIAPVRVIKKLPYFDLEEVFSARRLSMLLRNGVKQSSIEKKLYALRKLNPRVLTQLTSNDLVIQGKNILLRQNEHLLEATGQIVFDFEAFETEQEEEYPEGQNTPKKDLKSPQNEGFTENPEEERLDSCTKDLRWEKSIAILDQLNEREEECISIAGMRSEAFMLEEAGRLADAEEMWRNILLAAGANAEDAFQLGDLLWREKHLEAARERFSMAIEMDEDFVEARVSLGCILGELGDIELAIAALQGALAYHQDYAEAYYHLARFLELDGRGEEATTCYKKFLTLTEAKDSFWGKEATKRIEELEASQKRTTEHL